MFFDHERKTDYKPPRLTDTQMAFIERTIWMSRDARNDVKPILAWMLRQTENFTRPVALSLLEGAQGKDLALAFQNAAHNMVSSGGSTHFHTVCHAFETEMSLSHHFGVFREARGKHYFSTDHHLGNDFGTTVWFSYIWYDPAADVLTYPGDDVIKAIRP